MKIELLNKIQLINADCMDVLRELPDKSFDLAIYFDLTQGYEKNRI